MANKESFTKYDVIIIGGGASGLMCAITAAQRGRSVIVIDSSNKVGKKILMSGGGRCNFTNLYIEADCFISHNTHFVKSALSQYTQWDFISMVEKHGIEYHERKHGELFCNNSAKDILNMLQDECEQVGANIVTDCHIESVTTEKESSFAVITSIGEFKSESLVVATGALSIPTMGATGFGYDIAKQFSMKVKETRAGLVPFMFSDQFKHISERLSGLALEVTLSTDKKSFTENILFTHRGLSGPAVLQLSNYWTLGESIVMDLLPGIDGEAWLKTLKQNKPKARLQNLLTEHFTKNLIVELQNLFWPEFTDTAISEIPDEALVAIAEQLHGWQLKPSGTEGYRTAEVTLCGVDTDELSSKTMESKKQAGLFFIGEVVDVTGHLGGFNFQWAWSSGYVAGLNA